MINGRRSTALKRLKKFEWTREAVRSRRFARTSLLLSNGVASRGHHNVARVAGRPLGAVCRSGVESFGQEPVSVHPADPRDCISLHFSRDLFGSDVVRAGRRVGLIVPDGYGRSAGVARGRAFHGRWGPRVGWRVSCCSGEGGPKSLPSFGYRGGPAPGGVDA